MIEHVYHLDFLWNNHDWYKIENNAHFIRALVWCTANLVTAYAYFAIPWELYNWLGDAVRITATRIIALGFIAFITLCGMSHVAMVLVMPTGPWWATLLVYVPMAVVSLATAIFLKVNRKRIIEILNLLGALFGTNKK